MTLRILADGAWGVHSTTDLASLSDQIESTTRLAKAVAKRRSSKERAIGLAEVPVLQETHWRSKLDVRDTNLDQKMDLMNDMYRGASGHDDIVSFEPGWSDEYIHTELMTTEGMDRCGPSSVPSFTGRSRPAGTVRWSRTAHDTVAREASKSFRLPTS